MKTKLQSDSIALESFVWLGKRFFHFLICAIYPYFFLKIYQFIKSWKITGTYNLAVLVLMFFSMKTHGDSLVFNGVAEYYNGFTSQTKIFQIDGAIVNDSWKIRIYTEGRSNELGHVEYGFIGTNQYYMEYANTDPYRVVCTKTNVIFINGAVWPKGIPTSITSFIHVYWLALDLCLGNTIDLPKQLPASMLSGPLNTNFNAVSYTTSSDGKSIKSVEFLNPGIIYGTSGNFQESPPYDKGYVAARFLVNERSSLGSKSVPVSFDWLVYDTIQNGTSSNDLRTIHRLKVNLKLESEADPVVCIPKPPSGQRIVVKDYRLAAQSGDPNALYVSLFGFVEPNDKLFQTRKKDLSSNAGFTSYQKKAKIVLFTLMGITTVGCFLMLRRK